MKRKDFHYLYGPVCSWRLGSSLGIDLLSEREKPCSFDCIYCQLGETKVLTTKRKVYVSTGKVIREIKRLPKLRIDYITFSGRGEPTLAKNLGQTIEAIKKLRKEPIAVLTNSTLLNQKSVRKELSLADLVVAKLDVSSERFLKLINRPAKKVKFSGILKGIKQFRKEYQGKLALQLMFMRENENIAQDIARLTQGIHPNEVQINTPLRFCYIKPLSRKIILRINKYFSKMNTISPYSGVVHRRRRVKTRPINTKDTKFRRGRR
jgi:wyosine [tRNA(Phe)-imidazoG37] synthetase (radical SAM superfamily)